MTKLRKILQGGSAIALMAAMTMVQALIRLQDELLPREDAIRSVCSVPASDNQHAAMVCLAYNVGLLVNIKQNAAGGDRYSAL